MHIEDSSRLSFTQLGADDAGLLFELDQDTEVMRYINGGRKSTMEEINNVLMPRLLSYRNTDNGWGIWKVTVKADNSYIGWVLVRPMDFFTDAPLFDDLELGWRFKQVSWGKGYATEAAHAIKDAMTEQKGIRKFSAMAIEGNTASIKIMEKLGMQYVKTEVHQDPLGDMELVFYQVKV